MNTSEIIAVIPAAGRATRWGSMINSKEVQPLLDTQGPGNTTLGLLLDQLERAGVPRAVVVLREGKWDIPTAILKHQPGIDVVYQIIRPTKSVPETLAKVLSFVCDSPVLFAFPDLFYEPLDAFTALIEGWQVEAPDILIALFENDRPDKSDMVELDSDGKVVRLWIKSSRRDLTYAWGAAIWGARFSRRVRESVSGLNSAANQEESKELNVGEIIQHALNDGMNVSAVVISNGRFLDIGTREDLDRVRQRIRERTC